MRGIGTKDRDGIVTPVAPSKNLLGDLRHTLFRAATGESLSRGIRLAGTRRFGKRLAQCSIRATRYSKNTKLSYEVLHVAP